MVSFRRVEAELAGPSALGILVPPGKRTFVILRPRAVPWDLLLCRGADNDAFRDLAHDEASAAALALFRALREGTPLIEAVPADGVFRLRARVGAFTLLACSRAPGQPYAPFTCEEAVAGVAVARLHEALCPAEGEVYFNTRHFERQGSAGPARA